jgi:hypothetical protein
MGYWKLDRRRTWIHPVLAAHLRGATSATNMVEQLVEAAALTGPPPDDLTVVVLRCYDEH